MRRPPLTVLMFGSLPLAGPWNGADKALARTIVNADAGHRYIVQTGRHDAWPGHVHPARESDPAMMPGVRSQLRALWFLVRHARRIDVVHLVASVRRPSPPIVVLLRWCSRRMGLPIVHSMPAMADDAIRRTGAIGDVTVVFSRHTADRLRSAGIPNVVEMFPPVDVDQDRAGESAEALRLRLGLGPLPILYAAHLDRSSGIREAILAMARLPEPLQEATLVLAVRWRTGQNVEAAIADLNAVAIEACVADRVRWITRVDDMLALIAACRLTALVPRELDGKMDLPLVLLESLALGRPVVLADWPPLNEALLGGGLAVPFGDPAALAEAFAQLLSWPDLRSELAATGRRQVEALSDPAIAVALYDEAYQLAVSRHPGRRRAA